MKTMKDPRFIAEIKKQRLELAPTSGRRTRITVAGKKARRKALKVGMKCEFT